MPAPEGETHVHLQLVQGNGDSSSARHSRHARRQGREGRQFEPRHQEVKIGIAGRGRPGRSALHCDLPGGSVRIDTTSQADSKQAGGVGDANPHELLEAEPKLRLIGARRQGRFTAPLLTQRPELGDEVVERDGVGVQEQRTPDDPDGRRRGFVGRLALSGAAFVRRLVESLCNGWLLEPTAGVGHTGGAGDGRQRTKADGVAEQPLSVYGLRHTKGAVEQIRPLGANAKSVPLDAGRQPGRAGAKGIAAEKSGEFVGGREGVRGVPLRRAGERSIRALRLAQGGESLRDRHGVHRPMPIDQIRAARGRGGEDRV